MTGTQREPGEGQRQRQRPRDTSLEKKRGKDNNQREERQMKQKRGEEWTERLQREACSRPCCRKCRPPLPSSSWDWGWGPRVSRHQGCHPSTPTDLAPAPTSLPALSRPQSRFYPSSNPSPWQQGSQLTWAKMVFPTHFWALQNPQPIPPPLFPLLPEEEENLVSNWC